MKFSLKKPKPNNDNANVETTTAVPEEDGKKFKLGKKPSLTKSKLTGSSKKTKAKKPTIAKKNKQSFDFKKFMAEVNSLNGQNYGSAPVAVRGFILVMLAIVILTVAWFFLIAKKLDEIKAAESQQVELLKVYEEKESKARHLKTYEEQVAQMQVDFAELLNQLPKETRVPELIDGINMVGSGSGIRFQDISAQAEVTKEFFIEQPIQIIALGDYHQFGSFVSGIAALPRIITMHDFEVKNPQPSLDRMPEQQMVLQTKTYRSKPIEEVATPTNESNKKGGKQDKADKSKAGGKK